MVHSISSNRGFIADLYSPISRTVPSHKSRALIAASALALALSLALLLHPVPSKGNDTNSETIAPSPANNSYEFRVYSLTHTLAIPSANGTVFFFDLSRLPVNMSSIQFCDFRGDTQYRSIYYAGSGILLNASGSNASITLKEGNGKLISNILYHGQRLVVLNGQTTTHINCGSHSVYSGTDLMVQDWRNGNWTPNDGILIEHPNNVTISGARLCLAVYQPVANVQVPEFELLPATMIVFFVVILARRCH